MGFLDDYSDADPNHKSIRGNGITTFLFHVAQCVLWSIKDFATSTNFETARRRFHYETGKSKVDQTKTIGLQCLYTIP